VDLAHGEQSAQLVAVRDFVAGQTDCPPRPQDKNGDGTHARLPGACLRPERLL
jgi:hypothetical protein